MKRLFLLLALLPLCLPLAAQSAAQTESLSLSLLPALVLDHDPSTAISAQSALFAYHVYKGSVAQALPQIDFTTSYTLGYIPLLHNLVQIATFPYFADETTNDQGNHLLNTKLSISQILPTAGSLFLSLEDAMTVDSFRDRKSVV
jgi:hypothetical protein